MLGEEKEGKQDIAQVSTQSSWGEGQWTEMRKPKERHGRKGREDSWKITFEMC